MFESVASAVAHGAHGCAAGTSTQPAPCTLRSHSSVVTQICPTLHITNPLPPASTPRQPALGGGHWNVPLAEQAPPSDPPLERELDSDEDEQAELEPVLPEREPDLEAVSEPDEEPELDPPSPEREPPPPFELLPHARSPLATASAPNARSIVMLREVRVSLSGMPDATTRAARAPCACGTPDSTARYLRRPFTCRASSLVTALPSRRRRGLLSPKKEPPMQRTPALLLAALLGSSVSLFTPAAHAGPDACFLSSTANCQFVVSPASCEAMCTPGSFTAQCEGQCNATASVNCTGSCQTSCEASCKATPATFTCSESCTGECMPSCQTACSGNSDESACVTACGTDCTNRCEVDCSGTSGSVDCSASCQTSCNASCQVQADVSCQTTCTATATAPECTADCALPTGALFCDGQYIDVTKATSACASYIESLHLSASATCTTGATGSVCSGAASCSVSPAVGANRAGWGGLAGLAVALGLVASRRRKAR